MAVHLSSSGVSMPASISSSGDANTLDDYEEGTWTGAANGTLSSNNWPGGYVKIGTFIHISMNHPGAASASGDGAYMTGLPFTPHATAQNGAGSGVIVDGTPSKQEQFGIYGNTDNIYFAHGAIASDTGWVGSGTYRSAS